MKPITCNNETPVTNLVTMKPTKNYPSISPTSEPNPTVTNDILSISQPTTPHINRYCQYPTR